MLDLSSAFDAVDHDILLSGLSHKIGIKWRVLEWSASHLSKRSQFISVNSDRSRHFDVYHVEFFKYSSSSVSFLVLYYVYYLLANWKLFSIVERHLPDAYAFADDSQLYVFFKPDSTCDQFAAFAVLEHWIADIKD